jgi:Na+-transporting methylmalonyl-CoA/oxaloacetate decarboxylase gamma subunit
MVLASAAPAASQVVPGILGFLVVAGMGLILFFLLRSMNKQLRKVIPDPAWRKETSQTQAQVETQEQQDYTTNGTAQT